MTGVLLFFINCTLSQTRAWVEHKLIWDNPMTSIDEVTGPDSFNSGFFEVSQPKRFEYTMVNLYYIIPQRRV